MYLRAYRKGVFCIPILIGFLLLTTKIWIPWPLIAPIEMDGFSKMVEMTIPFVLLALCSFILPNDYEIELALVCGASPAKLAFSKFWPILTYTLLSAYLMLGLYQYTPYDPALYGFKIRIPIYVPDNFKVYMFISLTVTILFFASLFFFIRVVTRNCYISVAVGMFIEVIFDSNSSNIHQQVRDIRTCIIDPFISGYFVSDEVPNAFAERYTDMAIMHNAWTNSKIIFFVLSILLLVASYFVLRREKLHKGFGE